MRLSIQKLFAAVMFASIVMANVASCAACQQTGQRSSNRLNDSRLYDRHADAPRLGRGPNTLNPAPIKRLGAERLTDLRAPKPQGSLYREAAPVRSQTVLMSSPERLSIEVPAVAPYTLPERSYFGHNEQQPVAVWLNSDLQSPLMSPEQLKQCMHSIPEQHDHASQIGSQFSTADSGSMVRAASFSEPSFSEPNFSKPYFAGPVPLAGPLRRFNDFKKRLNKIEEEYKARFAQVNSDESIDVVSKGELNNLLKLANEWKEKAAAGLVEYQEKQIEKNGFEKELAGLKAILAEQESLASDQQKKAGSVQKQLKVKEAKLLEFVSDRNDIREQISNRDKRVTELPELQRKNGKAEDETKRLIEELSNQPDDLSKVLQELLLDAKLLSQEITEKLLELKVVRNEQLGSTLPLRLKTLVLQIKQEEADLVFLHEQSDLLRNKEIEARQIAAAEALVERLTKSTPALKELAKFNQDLADELPALALKSDQLEEELLNVKQLQEELDVSHDRLKEQIANLGPTASGIRVVEHRRSLISTGESQNRLLELNARMQLKQTRKVELKDRLDHLVFGDDFSLAVYTAVENQVFSQVHSLVEQAGTELSEAEIADLYKLEREKAIKIADQLLETQRKYATDIVSVLDDNIRKLAELEAAHKALIDKVQHEKAFSDENALWVRSAKPIKFDDLRKCQRGLRSIWASDNWQGLQEHTYQNFKHRPYDAGLLALVIGTLLVVRRRLRWSHE